MQSPQHISLTKLEGILTPLSTSPNLSNGRPASGDWSSQLQRPYSDDILRHTARAGSAEPLGGASDFEIEDAPGRERSASPPPLAPREAVERATIIADALAAADIPSEINKAGDIMLDMTPFKTSEDDMLKAEIMARRILSEKLDGNYDIGALFGFDEEGNLWIYSSEEARQAAMKKTMEASLPHHHHNRRASDADAASDPGYHSDGSDVTTTPPPFRGHRRAESDAGPMDLQTPPRTPTGSTGSREPSRQYAKTLRLTSEQLKDLELKPGENSMSFTVNRATCSAKMYLWKHETPVVISDIDGTITKSDALGHVLNMIGRDWTHSGVAKLYTDIAQNGYNIMYLTSRSVGQADTTRAYLYNIVQDGCRLPHGPTILSPDRTMAALRREIYLRKPHVFKMATLRDIRNLYGPDRTPFTAGFGNRLTDQISYRTVDVPRNRIFTINSNAEVSLDLLSLNKMKMSYVNINEVVDHYFPPVGTLVKGGGEEYTDFKYWRDEPLDLDAFSASGSDEDEDDDDDDADDQASIYAEDEDDDDLNLTLADSYISRDSYDDAIEGDSVLSNSVLLDDGRGTHARSTHTVDDNLNDDSDADVDDEGPASEDENDALDNDDGRLLAAEKEKSSRRKSYQQHDIVEDASAELITGVGHLSLGKDVPP